MRRGWSLTLQKRIRPAGSTPLYMQLAHALIHEIERGGSSRVAAAQQPGTGHRTGLQPQDGGDRLRGACRARLAGNGGPQGDRGRDPPAARPTGNPESSPPIGRQPIYRFVPPPSRPIAVPPGRLIKLDEGSPDGSLFPPEALARAFRTAALYAARRQQLGYRDPCGSERLRSGLAAMLREERGLVVREENVCVTRGSQMGIALAARLLARPGAVALAEALTYEPAVAAFQAAGVPVLPVALDDEGIDVDAVERACRNQQVCAVFVTPHHQFPSTVSLAPERRLRLVELARQFGFAIIEDDYDPRIPLRIAAAAADGRLCAGRGDLCRIAVQAAAAGAPGRLYRGARAGHRRRGAPGFDQRWHGQQPDRGRHRPPAGGRRGAATRARRRASMARGAMRWRRRCAMRWAIS
jgi:GntR family transcriptional regulator/MocR family aminotransferase